jgi:Amt family ammonium transporter
MIMKKALLIILLLLFIVPLLVGLVAITANCDTVTNISAIMIGFIAGILVILGIKLLDKIKIDDPVGAWPVHGLCGVWGGIATGLFGEYSLGIQFLGSVLIPLWSFSTMIIIFYILKLVGILRVNEKDEMRGLDITEHGEEAYYGFQLFITQ